MNFISHRVGAVEERRGRAMITAEDRYGSHENPVHIGQLFNIRAGGLKVIQMAQNLRGFLRD